MGNKINLLKNNEDRNLTDLEWVQEFYDFLQGDNPEGVLMKKSHPKLSKQMAFNIIWYLQEQFPLLPAHIEKCTECGSLYDSHSSGYHSELTEKFFCGVCFPPFLDEREDKILARRSKKKSS